MIRIPPVKKEIEIDFLKKQIESYKGLLQKKLCDSSYNNITRYFSINGKLDDNKIQDILIGEIDKLLDAIKHIGVIPNNSIQDDFKKLYNNFIKRKLGKTLAKEVGIKVCPYCNCSYVPTLAGVRPQYDHYFPKSLYPYLVVSLYNLIPCCPICNSNKDDFDPFDSTTQKRKFIYPHLDEYGYNVKFETCYKGDYTYLLGAKVDFGLSINSSLANIELQKLVQISKQELKIERLYETYKDHIVDIIKRTYIYNKQYVYDLFLQYPTLFNSINDVTDFLYMIYFKKEKWGERILSKLTYDIITEFTKH